jgi:hypothetical protein
LGRFCPIMECRDSAMRYVGVGNGSSIKSAFGGAVLRSPG